MFPGVSRAMNRPGTSYRQMHLRVVEEEHSMIQPQAQRAAPALNVLSWCGVC